MMDLFRNYFYIRICFSVNFLSQQNTWKMKFTRDDYNKRIVDKAGKIPDDEPVFLLRAQDVYSPSTLRYYAKLLEDDGNLEMA